MKKMNSLSFKVPFIISVIIFVTIFILGTLSVLSSTRAVKRATLNGFKSTVSGYASMIDMVLHEQLLAIDTYSKSSTVFGILYTNDINMKQQSKNRLKDFSSVNKYAINMGLADINGKIIVDSDDTNIEGTSISDIDPELFTRLKANNYNSSYGNNIKKDSQSLLLCKGLFNPLGNLIGIIYINIDLGKVNNDFIANINFDGDITVANDNGIIIFSSNKERIGTSLPYVYDITKTTSEGVIESYVFGYNKNKRSAAYKNINIMPWSVIFANYNSIIYKDISGIIFRTSTIGPFFIILACFLVAIYIKSITKPLNSLVLFAKEISQGNLISKQQNINRDDELGMLANSFFNMRDALLDIIMKVRVSADEITNSARALSKDSQDLSRRTDSQASSLQETASSMEEMASTIISSTNKSVDGNKMMINSKASIEHAGSIILDTVQNIEEVNEASTKIKNITKIIEDIAFQTNILALNAAVEAARAGDQGKGFAVVASEVRNLAQTTQSSVKDITNLVDSAYQKIIKATESARESQEIFKDIQDKIDVTSKIMDDISTTALEQQTGVRQVNKAITDMDVVTQQNAALVEHTSASSSSLLDQAEELVNAMSFFKV
ncbi:methyl-accepting chemotaxis protein [Brachyspira hyodysenteriae]|uniref:methyl-accepting chemotaxis protein n=1 Tax=Brachyspira hyodysenteriae TaxID=159 RepID=UPI0022CD9D6D|nr:methyl-accepting chemotaxis protein [Brachyspira hyodysenteriae]MCZ9876641.1 methyl-accepting chemotaxis protein [Brachyspira hyodysenteriae]MCZ9892133.1 methyl-accepting chemotaxis protein [Brachyspira hyodysenteriae]MCZ9934534.1 methyl-accepting chemotaxis protein [Brachyspira hyodysenteriae]MCZ9943455.1 methyl-accepting chemotaxis protein [Brachyspira hyodysenteriae]MCZ9947726.1 methyl-accepting chemotaxis protein [Brachyspira hyodysenteriae]